MERQTNLDRKEYNWKKDIDTKSYSSASFVVVLNMSSVLVWNQY
jgi:hypothetical protein